MKRPDSITVEELAARLDLIPIAGAAGLGNQISWAHVCELEDPTPWLFGGELLMTVGIAVPTREKPQLGYVRRLAEHGVSGLVLSDDLHVPLIHKTVLRAADELGFPLLRAHLGIPFITIAQEVASVTLSVNSARVKAQLDVFGAVRLLATDRLTPAEFVSRLARIARCSLYVCGPSGQPLLEGVEAPPEDVRAHVPADSEIRPPTLPGGFIVPIPGVDWIAGYVLAVALPTESSVDLAVTQHIATAIGLKMADMRFEHAVRRREQAELLSALLDGATDAAAATRSLVRAGFDDGARLRLLRLRHTSTAESDARVPTISLEEPALLLNRGRDRWALVLDDPGLWSAFDGDRRFAVGVSGPIRMGVSLRIARQEAEWAGARADSSTGAVVVYGDDALGRWLIPDQAVVGEMVEQVLGRLLAHDADNGPSLLDTLRLWLDSGRRVHETAKLLHVHDNTVAYRLKRVESLTGRDLSRTSDIAEVWLAVRALGHLPSTPR